jgi:hypothetical protein
VSVQWVSAPRERSANFYERPPSPARRQHLIELAEHFNNSLAGSSRGALGFAAPSVA